MKWSEINMAKFNNTREVLQETQVHTYNMGNKWLGSYTAKKDLEYIRIGNWTQVNSVLLLQRSDVLVEKGYITNRRQPSCCTLRVASTGVQFSAAHFQKDGNKPKEMQKTAITMKWFRKYKLYKKGWKNRIFLGWKSQNGRQDPIRHCHSMFCHNLHGSAGSYWLHLFSLSVKEKKKRESRLNSSILAANQ